MSGDELTVTREERDLFNGQLINALNREAGHLAAALRAADWTLAQRIGSECGAYMRLLDDLGWEPGNAAEPCDANETVVINVPDDELLRTL